MKNLKESFSLYVSNFRKIFVLMFPAILVGLVSVVYSEKAVGMDRGGIKIPSEPATLVLIALALMFFFLAIFWSQFALSESIAGKNVGALECYKRGWKRLVTVFGKLKNLPKIFGIKIVLIFVVWFAINGSTAFILQNFGLDFYFEKAVFSTLNMLVLIPFFHIYGFFLYKNQNHTA